MEKLTTANTSTLKDRLNARALALGFDVCRITGPNGAADAGPHLTKWLSEGRHGEMNWMQETAGRRKHPRRLWDAVNSIVMLGMNYGPAHDPLAVLNKKNHAAISVYAQNRDYHDVIKGRMKMLAQWLLAQPAIRNTDGNADIKVFVDTAPVMEKPLGAAAGLGWQGKHTNLVSREFGSWLFLGAIFTTVSLDHDMPESDHCGSCRACLEICPTDAFPTPYQLDARRCISYLTIEHKGHISREFRKAIGNRVFGCDDCLAVCPWNKFAQTAREAKLLGRPELTAPRLADLLALDDASFRKMFSASPVKRVGHTRFLRNLLIAAGNSDDATLLPRIEDNLRHEDSRVRAMAVWALGQLAPLERVKALGKAAQNSETDSAVLAEWAESMHLPNTPDRAAKDQ